RSGNMKWRWGVILVLSVILVSVVVWFFFGRAKVVIGSKSFTESVILGDIAQHLVQAKDSTKHKRGLGGTRLVYEALLSGEIDVYPEYTGTIQKEILADDALKTDDDLRAALEVKGVRMSRSLGFSNGYALGMKKTVADGLGISKISGLARHPKLR